MTLGRCATHVGKPGGAWIMRVTDVVVLVAVSRRMTSMLWVANRGVQLVNTTYRPLGLIAKSIGLASGSAGFGMSCAPEVVTFTRLIAPVVRSVTNRSSKLLVSPGTRFGFDASKAT